MGATLKESGDKRAVFLDNNLTLPHAEAMKKAFLRALVEADDVTIRFDKVQDVDLSCLQLICSAHRSAVRLKKRIVVEGVAPDALRKAADAAGYLRFKGCKLDCDRSCIWAAMARAKS